MSDVTAAPRPSRAIQAMQRPRDAARISLSLLRGWWYKTWLPMRGIRFSAGRNFRVNGRLVVNGPGRVVFGDDVKVGMTVTPFTHSRDAVITVGDHTFLNGTRFGCERSISVGRYCILADARLMDTNFHSTRADRHLPTAPVRSSEVVIEDNVWIASSVGVLPGTHIGRNSVVGYGSVCGGKFPADSLIAGNPAVVVRSIEPGGVPPV